MQPQAPQNQPGIPAHLPPLAPAQPPATQPQPPTAPQPAGAPAVSLSEQTKLRAKQAVLQYRANPYQLSASLQQIKAEYLVKQFNVRTNPVDH